MMKRLMFSLFCLTSYIACFGWGEGVQLPYPTIGGLSWSPDGTKIAFSANLFGEEEPYDIYVVDIHTKQITNLTNTPTIHEDQPAWSPNGTLIAYQREEIDGQTHIWLMNPDGSNQRQLIERNCHNPVWSPDGNYLLVAGFFSGDTGEDDEVLLVTKEGEEVRLMIASPEPECPVGWAPNNRFILFTKPYRGAYGELIYDDLWRYDLETKSLLKLATGGFLGPLSFSPDSSKVVYNENGALWIMNNDGSGKNSIFDRFDTEHLAARTPVFSPNGQKIAFILNTYEQICGEASEETYWNPGAENIYLINPDGTGLEQITFFTGFLAKGQNPNVFVKGKSKSFVAKAVKAKPSEKKGASSEGVQISTEEKGKIARNIPVPRQEAPMKEDSSSPTQAPLLAGGLSLSALGYAIWKFLRMLS